jgi:hypothetical protein
MQSISENQQNSFRALAHVIESKLQEMQMTLIAHRSHVRFVHIKHNNSLTNEEVKTIEESINKIYDLPENFCNAYNITAEQVDLKTVLMIKANFLWEDVSGATAKSLRGYGAVDEKLKIDYEQKVTEMIDEVNNLIKQLN